MSEHPLRILVVVAHPHDFTHCSATCGIHAARGDSVTLVTVTSGAQTHNERLHDELLKPEAERDPQVVNQGPEDYAEIKEAEVRQVCGLFGVSDVRIMQWPQPFRIEKNPGVVDDLRQVFYDVRPHVLITQKPYYDARNGMALMARDDHNETAIAVLEARGLASMPNYETRERPHTTAVTYYLGAYFTLNEIDFYVDITEWRDKRIEAETLFESQGQFDEFARKRVEIGAGSAGWSARVGYAEGFVRAEPEVLQELHVPEIALRRAEEPREAGLRRLAGLPA